MPSNAKISITTIEEGKHRELNPSSWAEYQTVIQAQKHPLMSTSTRKPSGIGYTKALS